MPSERKSAENRVSWDASSGLIRVNGLGFWNSGEIDVILDGIARLVGVARSQSEQVRVLIDLGDNGAQMGDTVDRLKKRSASIYATGDRIAIVLRSSLLKMQVARVERSAESRTFSTVEEAEGWLASPQRG